MKSKGCFLSAFVILIGVVLIGVVFMLSYDSGFADGVRIANVVSDERATRFSMELYGDLDSRGQENCIKDIEQQLVRMKKMMRCNGDNWFFEGELFWYSLFGDELSAFRRGYSALSERYFLEYGKN